MIAKRVMAPRGGSGFAGLARYVVNARAGVDPASWERLGAYVVDANHAGEKVAWSRVTNCNSTDPGWAVREIIATQGRNTRAGPGRNYHLVVSFPEGEKPSREQVEDIEDRLVEAIGFQEHQRISAVHHNTDNWHLHVAISTVHPTTFKNIAPFRDHFRLQAACAELEIKHGLTVEPHTVDPAEARKEKARARTREIEAKLGGQSFAAWVRVRKDALLAAKSWAELHQAAATLDLVVKPRGAGLVIGHAGDGRLNVKASAVDRGLSLKALNDRLGEFQPARGEQGQPARERYTRPGRSGALWERFQTERGAAVAVRKAETAAMRARHLKHAKDLQAFYAERKRQERAISAGPARRNGLAVIATQERQAHAERREREKRDRRGLAERYPVPNWLGWLEAEAGKGNEVALKALRSRQQRAQRIEQQVLQAEGEAEARHIVHQHLRPAVRRDGRVVYWVADGGLVSDEAAQVRVATATAAANILALSLASDRFRGRPLIVRGSEDFRHSVAQLAGQKKLGVTFADPNLERMRASAAARPLDRQGVQSIDYIRKGVDLER